MAKRDEFIGDIAEKARAGWLGPEAISPESIYGEFRQMLGQARQAGAGFLAGAAQRAGRVPTGVAARVGAITQAGELQAGVQLAGIVSGAERQRYQSAMDRWFTQRRLDLAQEAQETSFVGGILGGVGSLLGSFLGYRGATADIRARETTNG